MKPPYRITLVPSTLYRLGISYHKTGQVKALGRAYWDFYKCNEALTDEQIEQVRAFCPDVSVRSAGSQYAPEHRLPVLLFPKAAWYRKRITY